MCVIWGKIGPVVKKKKGKKDIEIVRKRQGKALK